MNSKLQFGETVLGYNIPVVNKEKCQDLRIMFLATFISLMLIMMEKLSSDKICDYIIFMVDFSIRLFLSPKFSPDFNSWKNHCKQSKSRICRCATKEICVGIRLVLSFLMFVLNGCL